MGGVLCGTSKRRNAARTAAGEAHKKDVKVKTEGIVSQQWNTYPPDLENASNVPNSVAAFTHLPQSPNGQNVNHQSIFTQASLDNIDPSDYLRTSSNFVSSDNFPSSRERVPQPIQRYDMAGKIPDGCVILNRDDEAKLIDIVKPGKYINTWRGDTLSNGVCHVKVLSPKVNKSEEESGDFPSGPPESPKQRSPMRVTIGLTLRGSIKNLSKPSETDSGRSWEKEEQIFQTELHILCHLQSRLGFGGVHSPSNPNNRTSTQFSLAQGSKTQTLKPQHRNVINFVGYMEGPSAPLDLNASRKEGVQRMYFTESYVNNLRAHARHRTQNGKRDMRHFEATLYANHIAQGLQVLHENQVVHRRLTTANIVMCAGVLDRDYRRWLKNVSKSDEYNQFDPNRNARNPNNVGISVQIVKNGRDNRHMQAKQKKAEAARMSIEQSRYFRFLQTQPLIAKISNFGESKIIHQRTNTRVGDMRFMAPEMMRGENYGFSCDIWSFGCILFELISGDAPFYRKGNATYIENKVLGGKFPRNDKIGSRRFNFLESVMRNCLKTEAELRCNAKELIADLKQL